MSHKTADNITQQWSNELTLITKEKTISLFMTTKKEKIQWLTEFSRAIEWADAAMVIKAKHSSKNSKRNSGDKSQQDNKIAKANLIIKEIQSMEPAVIDGLS